jgi:hypothetical protein
MSVSEMIGTFATNWNQTLRPAGRQQCPERGVSHRSGPLRLARRHHPTGSFRLEEILTHAIALMLVNVPGFQYRSAGETAREVRLENDPGRARRIDSIHA